MKKKIVLLLALIGVLSVSLLTSCGSSPSPEATTNEKPKYADQDFMNSLAKGLEARWSRPNADEDTVQSYKDAIQAELDQVEQYSTALFEDSVLQEKALGYINVLKESMENVDYAFSDTEYTKWSDIYDKRTIMVKDFVDNYGLTVSEDYQSTLDELVANGNTAGEEATKKEEIEKLVSKLKFKKTNEEYDWITYQAVLENTTNYDITDLSLEINLLDKDGVIIETAYADTNNVAKGKKARLEFSTDKSFDEYETAISYYELK